MAILMSRIPSMRPMYRTRLSGPWVALRGAPEGLSEPCGAGVERAAMAVLLDQPFGVVANDEGTDGVAHLVDGLEDASMHDLPPPPPEQGATPLTAPRPSA